jgi:hypothetical protein
MANSLHSVHEKKNHAYLYSHVKNVSHYAHHDTCNDRFAIQSIIVVSLLLAMCMLHLVILIGVELCVMLLMLFLIHLRIGMHLMDLPFYSALYASYVIHCKNDKIVATNVGPKCKKGKTCIWVLKS